MPTRFERMQNNRNIEKQAGLKEYLKTKEGADKNAKTIIKKISGYLNKGNESLYSKYAREQDVPALFSLEKEIDARIKKTGIGVLIQRLTKRAPDLAGNFLPEYMGLLIVADGFDEIEAQSNYDSKKNPSTSQASNMGVCTPLNPTGRPERVVQTTEIGPSREGYNMGYASQLADKVNSVLKNNPKNIGEIAFDSIVSPIQPLAYIEEEFFFISKEDWLNRDGICRPDYHLY